MRSLRVSIPYLRNESEIDKNHVTSQNINKTNSLSNQENQKKKRHGEFKRSSRELLLIFFWAWAKVGETLTKRFPFGRHQIREKVTNQCENDKLCESKRIWLLSLKGSTRQITAWSLVLVHAIRGCFTRDFFLNGTLTTSLHRSFFFPEMNLPRTRTKKHVSPGRLFRLHVFFCSSQLSSTSGHLPFNRPDFNLTRFPRLRLWALFFSCKRKSALLSWCEYLSGSCLNSATPFIYSGRYFRGPVVIYFCGTCEPRCTQQLCKFAFCSVHDESESEGEKWFSLFVQERPTLLKIGI